MTTLSMRDLTVKRSDSTLLERLSLDLGPTGSVALVGPNGAGKSTLLKVMAGLESPTFGSVRAGASDVAALSATARTRLIGYLPQHFEPHWDLTAGQLVELGAQRVDGVGIEAVRAALAAYELERLAARRWSTLSGGECARVLLAMVLVSDPPVLLADEPAAALDIRHRLDVVASLARRGGDRLSVVVVHDLDLAFRYFDRIVVLDRGRIAADGTAAELLHDERLDTTFGVRFERISTSAGWSVVAQRLL